MVNYKLPATWKIKFISAFSTFFYSHDVAVVVQGVKILATIEGVLLGRYFDTLVGSDAARHGGVTALCSYATP